MIMNSFLVLMLTARQQCAFRNGGHIGFKMANMVACYHAIRASRGEVDNTHNAQQRDAA